MFIDPRPLTCPTICKLWEAANTRLMHEKRAHVLPCTRSRPDQEPCVNAIKENAPSWTHLHLHAVHTLNLVGSDRTACSFDATLLCGRGWVTADATQRVPPCQFPAYGSNSANSHNSGQTRIMKISLRPTSDSIPKSWRGRCRPNVFAGLQIRCASRGFPQIGYFTRP